MKSIKAFVLTLILPFLALQTLEAGWWKPNLKTVALATTAIAAGYYGYKAIKSHGLSGLKEATLTALHQCKEWSAHTIHASCAAHSAAQDKEIARLTEQLNQTQGLLAKTSDQRNRAFSGQQSTIEMLRAQINELKIKLEEQRKKDYTEA